MAAKLIKSLERKVQFDNEKEPFLVYKKLQQEDTYCLSTVFDENRSLEEYGDDEIVVPLGSVVSQKLKFLEKGTLIKNISGSSDDRVTNINLNSWIAVIEFMYQQNGIMVSPFCPLSREGQYLNNPSVKHSIVNHHSANRASGALVYGGHVLAGNDYETIMSARTYKGGNALLIPICPAHNFFGNDNTYFELEHRVMAVELTYFLESEQLIELNN